MSDKLKKKAWKRALLNLGYSHKTALSKQTMKKLSQRPVSKPVSRTKQHEAEVPKIVTRVSCNK